MSNNALVVLCTVPDADVGAGIAQTLVEERLAACVNLIPGVRSFYRWEGKICDDAELLAVIKTSAERFEQLRARVVALHPYDCPEVIAMAVDRGHPGYLQWLADSVQPLSGP